MLLLIMMFGENVYQFYLMIHHELKYQVFGDDVLELGKLLQKIEMESTKLIAHFQGTVASGARLQLKVYFRRTNCTLEHLKEKNTFPFSLISLFGGGEKDT